MAQINKVKYFKNKNGMTLVEVSIAVLLFSIFAVAFISGQGNNVLASIKIKQEILLKNLAQSKLNEIIIHPPQFQESLTSAGVETKDFVDFPEYQYSVEFKKLEIPDLSKLVGGDEEGNDGQGSGGLTAIQEKIFKALKLNIEKLIWQVSVIIRHKESDNSYKLTSWLFNEKAKIKINGL